MLPGGAGGYYGYAVCTNNVAAVTGACLAIERAKLDAVAGFDEGLAVAYNDVDLGLKLLKAGYRNVLLPNIQVVHHESASRGSDMRPEKWSRLLREGSVLQQKWASTFWRDPFYSPNLTLLGGDCAVASRAERTPRRDAWSSTAYEQRNVDYRDAAPASKRTGLHAV
jgi:GT2 family glycosyltransferase